MLNFYREYLKKAAHVPSELTIQGPIGSSGVQAEANNGHSVGFIFPFKTSPHKHFL